MLATNLKQLREAAGLTQAAFAAKVGLPLRTIQNWEQGHREPRLEMFPVIAEALGVSPGRLIATETTTETVWLTRETIDILNALAGTMGISQDALVEVAIKELAERKLPKVTNVLSGVAPRANARRRQGKKAKEGRATDAGTADAGSC